MQDISPLTLFLVGPTQNYSLGLLFALSLVLMMLPTLLPTIVETLT